MYLLKPLFHRSYIQSCHDIWYTFKKLLTTKGNYHHSVKFWDEEVIVCGLMVIWRYVKHGDKKHGRTQKEMRRRKIREYHCFNTKSKNIGKMICFQLIILKYLQHVSTFSRKLHTRISLLLKIILKINVTNCTYTTRKFYN